MSAEDKRSLVQRAVLDEVKKSFRPEFINRLDEIVVFRRLEQTDIRKVVDIQLARFTERLAKREITLSVTDAAKDFLAREGWDPQYGARPLKRAIRKHLEDPVARRVLGGEFPPGTAVSVGAKDDELTFSTQLSN